MDEKAIEQTVNQLKANIDALGVSIFALMDGLVERTEKAEPYEDTLHRFVTLLGDKNRQITELEQEIIDIKSSIILDKSKANRDGRPSFSKTKPEVTRRILDLRKQGLSYRKIAKATGVSPTTAYNYIAQRGQE